MTRLNVYLMGNFQVCLDKQPSISMEAGKTSALLAYIVIEGSRPLPRQTLAELLWPERSPEEALSSLRFALSKLRTVLKDRQAEQPLMLVSRLEVQLNPQADIWVDAAAFRAQATACETQNNDPGAIAALQAALSLYRGSFLQSFPLGDSLAYETWALTQREQLDYHRLHLLDLLSQRLEAEGQSQQADQILRILLTERPWDEDIHRRLMRLLADSGQRPAALAQYEACRRALAILGIEPDRATNQLYQQIRQSLTPALEVNASVFVARQNELARLDAALARSLAGQGQVALISGEAGSGKTALMSEFVRLTLEAHPNLLAVGGQCDAYLGLGQPYQPFIEIIQTLAGVVELPWVEHLPAENQVRLRQRLPWIAQTLVETAPVLLDYFINRVELARAAQSAMGEYLPRPKPAWLQTLTRSSAASPRLETAPLYEQFTRFLAAISCQVPLVLVLDDLHWGDPGSASLFFHLARRLVSCRVLFLAAYRSGEIKRPEGMVHHPLTVVLAELQRYGVNNHTNLDRADEGAFVSAFLDQDPQLHPNRFDATFRNALARQTGGNPLFTIELLRSLQTHGELFLSPDGFWESRSNLDWGRLPERTEAVIARQIERLSSFWREWLTTASVEGETFTAEVLAQVHGIEVQRLLEEFRSMLSQAKGAQPLLQAEGMRWIKLPDGRIRSLSRYRFSHNLFQAYLYQQLDPIDRTRRHAAVATALEDLYGGDAGGDASHYAPALARHFELGGIPEKAAAYLLEVGRQAASLESGAAAVQAYQHGLALLAGAPRLSGKSGRFLERLEVNLYLALAAPFLRAEGWGGIERQKMIQKAMERIQQIGLETVEGPEKKRDPVSAFDISSSSLFPALFAQADWLISQGESQQATILAEEMLALAGIPAASITGLSPDKGQVAILAYRILGFSCLFRGEFLSTRRHLETLLEVYKTSGPISTLALTGVELEPICRSVYGLALTVLGYPDQGWQQAQQALHRARDLKHAATLYGALVFTSEIPVLRQDLPAFQQIATELYRLGQASELDFIQAYGMGNEGFAQVLAAVESGNAAQASLGIEMIQQGLALWKSTGTLAGYGQWLTRLAHAYLLTGHIAEGLAVTTQALALPDDNSIAVGLAQLHRLHGELLLRSEPHDRRAAETCFTRAIEIARQQSARTYELAAALSLARLWQTERPHDVHDLLAEPSAWFTEGRDMPDWREAQTLLQVRSRFDKDHGQPGRP